MEAISDDVPDVVVLVVAVIFVSGSGGVQFNQTLA
jgi:hypothetical protein